MTHHHFIARMIIITFEAMSYVNRLTLIKIAKHFGGKNHDLDYQTGPVILKNIVMKVEDHIMTVMLRLSLLWSLVLLSLLLLS